MKSGTIKLLYKGEIISSQVYYDKTLRDKIIDKWKKRYMERFYKCELQIAPIVKEEWYNRRTGLNMRWRKEKTKQKRRDEKFEKIDLLTL